MDNEQINKELRERRDELIRWRANADRETLKHSYVVVSRYGTVVGFDIEGMTATNPRPVRLIEATFFPMERARYIADRCTDPSGSICGIRNVGQLLDEHIAQAGALLNDYDQSAFTMKG